MQAWVGWIDMYGEEECKLLGGVNDGRRCGIADEIAKRVIIIAKRNCLDLATCFLWRLVHGTDLLSHLLDARCYPAGPLRIRCNNSCQVSSQLWSGIDSTGIGI